MRIFSLRSFWLPVLLTTLAAAIFGAVLARRGRGMQAMLDQEEELGSELAALTDENGRLRAERDALLTSPEAIERVAREDFGFAAPGERTEDFQSSPVLYLDAQREEEESAFWEKAPVWRYMPFVLPAATFVISCILFGLWNVAVRAAAGRAG